MENNESDLGIGGFIDVETTGLDPKKDEVIELCLILFSFNRETYEIIEIMDTYSGLREPFIPIKRAATKVHGITKKSIRGMCLDHDRIEAMLEKTEFLVAHNANFDRGFVEPLFPVSSAKPWFCSMNGIDWGNKGCASKGLQNLLKDHGIEVSQAHRATDDAKAAVELLSKCDKSGKTYLSELLTGESLPSTYKQYYKEAAATSEKRKAEKRKADKSKATGCGCLVIGIQILVLIFIVILLLT